jgi:hypothetical protein
MNCPKCNSKNVEVVTAPVVRCRDCENYFTVEPAPEPPRPAPAPVAPERPLTPADKVRSQAEIILLLAVVFVFIGVIALLVGVAGPPAAFVVCLAAFSLSVWLYLAAQLVYIRANTEK